MKIWPMFCKACGQGIDRGDKFCRNCGVPLPQEPIESAVAASAAAAGTGEPISVATSTAELQRPLPIPKALLTEVSSVAGVEEKPSMPATVAAKVPPPPDSAKSAAADRPSDTAAASTPESKSATAPQPKPEATVGETQKPAEAKPEGAAVAPQKPAEPKPDATATPAEPAAEKKVPSPETPAQPAPLQQAESSTAPVKAEQQEQSKPGVVPAEKRAEVIAAVLASASASKPPAGQAAAVSEQQAKSIEITATPQQMAKPDDVAPDPAARPLRLCPQCHRLVGEDDLFCERCKAKLDPPATRQSLQPMAEQNYGVPSFAGYAAEPALVKAAERPEEQHTSDPSGVDAIANLRVRKRRGLSVIEIVVAVILLSGAGIAVWMLRSSLPNKAAAPAPAVVISISPARAKVVAGHGYDFAATVAGTDNYNVDWSIDEGDSGGRIVPRGAKATDGAVSSPAVYMAPKTPGTYHLTATSKADAGKSASATITVTAK